MKKFIYLFVFALISCNLSCSSDDDEDTLSKTGPFEISELAGNWQATQAQFSSSSTSVDVVADGGTVILSIQSNGRFTMTIDPMNRPAYAVKGEMFWEEWQGTFYFAIRWDDEPDDWDTYGHTYDGSKLTLNGGPDSGDYDFNNDGTSESCSIHFTFERS